MAGEKNYKKVISETDCKVVFSNLLKPKEKQNWRIRSFFKTTHFVRGIPEKKFSSIKRKANKAADWIATHVRRGCA